MNISGHSPMQAKIMTYDPASILQKPDYFLDVLFGRLLNSLPYEQRKALLFSPLVNFRLLSQNRKLATSIAKTYQGEIDDAVKILISALNDAPENLHAAENLGYILFYLSDRNILESAWESLNHYRLPARADETSPRLLMVILALMLKLDVEGAAKNMEKDYIERVVSPNIQNKPKRPIFFWHIPKCSGTSANDIFYRHFYKRPEADLLPSYASFPLLQHCLQHYGDVFPYIASAHCGVDKISPPEKAFVFTVLRDPVERVISMYKQTCTALTHGYMFRQLPSYEFFWEKWKANDFMPWIDNLPPALLQRQLTTFSPEEDVGKAAKTIKDMDYYMIHKFNRGSFGDLFSQLKLPLKAQDMSHSLNKSPKGPYISEEEKQMLKDKLEKEYTLIKKLV